LNNVLFIRLCNACMHTVILELISSASGVTSVSSDLKQSLNLLYSICEKEYISFTDYMLSS
jgi:hypothetical protein